MDVQTVASGTATIPVSEFLYHVYGTNSPAGATGAAATSLASAVESYESALMTDSAYISAANDVYMAAATASNSDQIFSELSVDGAVNGVYTTDAWYVQNVPQSAKSAMASVLSGFRAVETSVLGSAAAATTTAGASTTNPTNSASVASSTGAAASKTSSSTAGAYVTKATGAALAGLAAVVAFGAVAL